MDNNFWNTHNESNIIFGYTQHMHVKWFCVYCLPKKKKKICRRYDSLTVLLEAERGFRDALFVIGFFSSSRLSLLLTARLYFNFCSFIFRPEIKNNKTSSFAALFFSSSVVQFKTHTRDSTIPARRKNL